MIHILHCVPACKVRSSSITVYLASLPFTTHPLPSGNHHTVVYECQFYVPHTNEIIWLFVIALFCLA